MPEGDTVWHTATILRDALAGKTLTRCNVRVPKYATVDLSGQVVDEAARVGAEAHLTGDRDAEPVRLLAEEVGVIAA